MRDIKEATNLDIGLLKPLAPFDRVVKHVRYIDYMARLVSGKLTPDSDAGEVFWVEKQCVQDIWNEQHEGTQRLLTISRDSVIHDN